MNLINYLDSAKVGVFKNKITIRFLMVTKVSRVGIGFTGLDINTEKCSDFQVLSWF